MEVGQEKDVYGITIFCYEDSIAIYYKKNLIFQAINVKEEEREEYLEKNRNLIYKEVSRIKGGDSYE